MGATLLNSEKPDQHPPNATKPASWIARWWPALVWAVVISLFSTALFREDRTSLVLIPVLHWFFPNASPDALARMHHYARKTAHFVEYFVFSLLILRAIRAGRQTTRLAWALAAIAIVGGYAAMDEFHQSFVPGRVPLLTDVLLDTTGGTAAQLAAAFFLLWAQRRQRRKSV